MKTNEKMKKISCVLVGILFCISGYAQMTVLSNGNVGVGVANPLSKFAVNDSGNVKHSLWVRNTSLINDGVAIRSYINTPAPNTSNNRYTSVLGTITCGNGWSLGLVGMSTNSTPQSTGRSYGVMGEARNATPGYNYGVYGLLNGSNNGAAIYGASIGNTDEDTEGNFAGYFKGRVYMSDKLSIGNKNSQYSVDVSGSVRAYAFLTSSDSCLKENVKDIDQNQISTLMKIRGVSYDLKKTKKGVQNSQKSYSGDSIETTQITSENENEVFSRKHTGFLAQEVQQVYPELVYKDEKGLLSVDYIGFIPMIVEALKKQEATISSQARCIDSLIVALGKSGGSVKNTNGFTSLLYDNVPNPFSTTTKIPFYIDDNAKTALIRIYNNQGLMVKSIAIDSRGDGYISIEKSDLNVGVYSYTLFVDGLVVDSKRMVSSN